MSNDWDFDMEVVEDKTDMQTGAVEKGDSSSTSRNLDDLPEIERVPDGWELDTIEGVAEDVLGGGTPSKSNEDYWGGEIPWASVKDLDGVAIQGTEDYITEEGVENSATNLISSGSVVISTRMTVGEAFMNLVDMAINQDLKAIKPDDSRVNTRFLVYALRGKDRYLKSLGRGTTVSGITTADLKRTHFARPPLPEQRKIASVLYAVDQAIQKTEAIIEQAKRVKRGLMQDLFREGLREHTGCQSVRIGPKEKEFPSSWEIKTLNSLLLRLTNGISEDQNKEGRGFPVTRIETISDGSIEYSKVGYVDKSKSKFSKYKIEKGDILFSHINSPSHLGKNAFYDGKKDLYHGMNLLLMRLDTDKISSKFAYYYINQKMVYDFWKSNCGKAVNQVSINQQQISRLKVPVPPKGEQKQIVDKIENLERVVQAEDKKSEVLKSLKRGTMQDLLTGEVRTADKAIEVLGEVNAHG